MLTFTQSDLIRAFGIGPRAATNWCQRLPYLRTGRVRRYNVADFLPTLAGKYAPAVPAFIALSRDDGQVFAGDMRDMGRAMALEGWLALHIPGAASRLWTIRQRFFDGLAVVFKSSAMMDSSEYLRLNLPRSGPVLDYLVRADEAALPRDWPKFCRQFAVVHAGGPTLAEMAA